jgi:hypothetical protein
MGVKFKYIYPFSLGIKEWLEEKLYTYEVIAKLIKTVTPVPAFTGINCSGGSEGIENTGFPPARRNDNPGLLQLTRIFMISIRG